MRLTLRPSVKLSVLTLTLGSLATGCSRETPAPAVSITGTMAPLAAVGSLLSVTASGPDSKDYTVAADAGTGAFRFLDLPAGIYTLKFTTTATSNFPNWVKVEVQRGVTATPSIPLITHDGVTRGLMRWTVGGTTYKATLLNGSFGNKLFLFGQANTSDGWTAVNIGLPEAGDKGKIFTGPGTYALGGGERDTFAEYVGYATGAPFSSKYATLPNAPASALQLSRFDAEQGLATGTFGFVATAYSNATGQRVITNGEFDITF